MCCGSCAPRRLPLSRGSGGWFVLRLVSAPPGPVLAMCAVGKRAWSDRRDTGTRPRPCRSGKPPCAFAGKCSPGAFTSSRRLAGRGLAWAKSPRDCGTPVARCAGWLLFSSLGKCLVRDAVRSEPVSCLISLFYRESTGKPEYSSLGKRRRRASSAHGSGIPGLKFPTRGAGNFMSSISENLSKKQGRAQLPAANAKLAYSSSSSSAWSRVIAYPSRCPRTCSVRTSVRPASRSENQVSGSTSSVSEVTPGSVRSTEMQSGGKGLPAASSRNGKSSCR